MKRRNTALFSICRLLPLPSRKRQRLTTIKHLLALFLLSMMQACSPGFVLQAGWEEFKILAAREPLLEAERSPLRTPEEREKLLLVADLQKFMPKLGMEVGGLFTSYAKVERETLVWVLMGARKDAFELYQWWFPIVGTIPYRGFFSESDATKAGQQLLEKDYEIWIRGADAFSTLGWFDDPLLSTTLARDPVEVVNIVIHETFHANIWLPHQVAFNESVANFVGLQGAVTYFDYALHRCSDEQCRATMAAHRDTAAQRLEMQLRFADILEHLYRQLKELYESAVTSEEKVAQRQVVYDQHLRQIFERFPSATFPREVNNAQIIQWRIYFTELAAIAEHFSKCNEDWEQFMHELAVITRIASRAPGQNPFHLLKQRAGRCDPQSLFDLSAGFHYSPPD